jgi:hypothetical protein
MISLAEEFGGTTSISALLDHSSLPAIVQKFIRYATIRAKLRGYAYFGNPSAAADFDVDPRTIRRWIELGVKADLLRVEYKGVSRRIYVCPEIMMSVLPKEKFPTFEDWLKGKTYRFYDLRGAVGKERPKAKAIAEKKHKNKLRKIKKKSPSWHKAKRRNARRIKTRRFIVFPSVAQQVTGVIFVPKGQADIFVRNNTPSPRSKDSDASLLSGQREKADAFNFDPSIPVKTNPASTYEAPDKPLAPVKRPRLWDVHVYASEEERDAARAFHYSRGRKATALVGEADADGRITLREDIAEQVNARLAASTVVDKTAAPSLQTRTKQVLGNSPYARQFLRAFFNAELEELPHDPVFFRSIAKRFVDGPTEKPIVIDDYTEALRPKPTQELWAKRWKLMKDFDVWQTTPQATLARCCCDFPDGWEYQKK